ncbi:hypothetical protein EMPS_07532 [Entomortierella parvispora]|uniref:F-box domain-containing protein n=1 Tax=Entomortierella parvispora TaxID=205924 RepID=A0A9P3LYF8_9FUNG|nr:hypothetical protein EMPS_07532 [Entomortierella parvispora]
MSQVNSLPQPLQILDLPDEILQKILAYCCSDEDLEFLLSSCRLITTKDQFCHQCYHCTLCHGPYAQTSRAVPQPTHLQGSQTQMRATTTPVTTTYTDCRMATIHTESQQVQSRRRRRRLPDSMGAHHGSPSGLDGHQNRSMDGLDLGYLFTGARRCPWNNHQRWGHRHGSASGNSRIMGVLPLPPLPLSRTWSLFGQAAAAAAATAAGVMRSSRNVGAGNGDPVVHVPGVQGSMMNNNNNNNRTMAMVKAGMGSASTPGGHRDAALSATTATYDTTCLPVLPPPSREDENQSQPYPRQYPQQQHQSKLQGGVYSPLPYHQQHEHHRHHTGKGCMNGENHSDGLRPVPPARTKFSSSSLPSSLTSPRYDSQRTTHLHAIADPKAAETKSTTTSAGEDARHSFLVTPVPADTAASSSSSCRVGNLHSRFSAQASSQTLSRQQQQQQQQQQQRHHVAQGPDTIGSSPVELAMPFQLLLVCKRFGNAVVQSLWDRVVFHGHDPVQVRALLSTLKVLEVVCSPPTFDGRSLNRSIALDEDWITNCSMGKNSNQDGETRSTPFWISPKGSSLAELNQKSDPCPWSISSRKVHHDGNLPFGSTRTTATTMTVTGPLSALGPVQKSVSPASLADLATGDEGVTVGMEQSRPARWAYSQLVRRVVLDFAHAQSSRALLIETLECLRAGRENPSAQSYRSLDFHASEKMRSSGAQDSQSARRPVSTSWGATLPESTPVLDLDRNFGWGSGFSDLTCLRLRGGFVDNQLLNAITKGMQTRQQLLGDRYSCRLSQVFLGPGSFTDSAVEKLIDIARSSLEVVMVTSCVDVSGGSLARFLTQCPKLRVLGFYRSLARDEDLFQGLGICSEEKAEMAMASLPQSGPSVTSSTTTSSPLSATTLRLHQETRKAIVAPLERLELSTMIKLSSKAIAAIVQGVSQSLKHLAVDSRHFNEEFLEEIFMAPSTSTTTERLQSLESLSFKDGSFHQKQQQQYRSSHSVVAAHSSSSTERPQRQKSPWLGDTSTEEWIRQGGTQTDYYFQCTGFSMEPSRVLSLTSNVRVQDRVLNCLLRGRSMLDRVCGRRQPLTSVPIPSRAEESYEGMLERFAVHPGTICRVVLGLSKLKSFTVLERNVVVEHETWLQQKSQLDSDSTATTMPTDTPVAISGDIVLLGNAALAGAVESLRLTADVKRWEDGLVQESSSRVPEALTAVAMTLTAMQIRWILILVAITGWVLVVVNSSDNSSARREDSQ